MPSISLVPFEEGMLPELFKIEQACFTDLFRFSGVEDMSDVLDASQVWVAKSNKEIAGYAAFEVLRKRGYVITVDVHPKFQGQGIGTKLMQAGEKHIKVRGYKTMRLHVHYNNPAQILYFRLGYRTTDIFRHYYEEGEHALVMVKNL